ncbi:hypothetical protein WJX72_010524 [[Myrmecia] bisecta]|uniref:Uncharacterized protein n=1 Tax=[Myrmecia] bisecta TaxID=41462 RepID=A0AAW1P3X2_9CHLO
MVRNPTELAGTSGPAQPVQAPAGAPRERGLSWDQLGNLGLHRALFEYYKMTEAPSERTPSASDTLLDNMEPGHEQIGEVRPGVRREGKPARPYKQPLWKAALIRIFLPQPPRFLELQAVVKGVIYLLSGAAYALVNTAPFTLPLLLWHTLGSKDLEVPTPWLDLKLSPANHAPSAYALLLVALASIYVAERYCTSVRQQKQDAEDRAAALRQLAQQLQQPARPNNHRQEKAGDGALKAAAAPAAAAKGAEDAQLQQLYAALTDVENRVYGPDKWSEASVRSAHSFADAVNGVDRLCHTIGVEFAPQERASIAAVAAKLENLKAIIG